MTMAIAMAVVVLYSGRAAADPSVRVPQKVASFESGALVPSEAYDTIKCTGPCMGKLPGADVVTLGGLVLRNMPDAIWKLLDSRQLPTVLTIGRAVDIALRGSPVQRAQLLRGWHRSALRR
jgi:hypothetical protein